MPSDLTIDCFRMWICWPVIDKYFKFVLPTFGKKTMHKKAKQILHKKSEKAIEFRIKSDKIS